MTTWVTWRKTEERDLPSCLRLHPNKNGSEIAGAAATLAASREMLRATPFAARSAVVLLHEGNKERIADFGLGAFVKETFLESELANPQPGLNARLIQSIVEGRSVLASYEEVRQANAAGNLQQVILNSTWDRESLTRPQRDQIRVTLGAAYQDLFAGYRLGRVLTETVDELDAWHASAHRAFRVTSRFEEERRAHPEGPWNPGRTLMLATAETMREDIGSIAATLFQNRYRPLLGFTRGEQELLEAALDGKDDAAAAESLFVTVAAIKKRWASIFDRVSAVMPSLCPPGSDGHRGGEKRSGIVEYVRKHREEIRPC